MANLQRARTEQVNKESAARQAKQKADKAAADAKASQDAAVAALTESKRKFDDQREEIDRLAAERDEAQARLEAAQLSRPRTGRRGRAGPVARRRATAGTRDHREPRGRPPADAYGMAGIPRCRRYPAPTSPATRSR